MTTIICALCAGAPFSVLPSGLFECGSCRELLHTQDLVLDPGVVWCVNQHGQLGYVTDTAESLAGLRDALIDSAQAEAGTYDERDARYRFDSAVSDLRAALRAGLPFPAEAAA
ncbi:hypothetical protein [Streptomyces variabilis]